MTAVGYGSLLQQFNHLIALLVMANHYKPHEAEPDG